MTRVPWGPVTVTVAPTTTAELESMTVPLRPPVTDVLCCAVKGTASINTAKRPMMVVERNLAEVRISFASVVDGKRLFSDRNDCMGLLQGELGRQDLTEILLNREFSLLELGLSDPAYWLSPRISSWRRPWNSF